MLEDSLCISFIDNGNTHGAFTYSLADSLVKLKDDINISHILRWSGSSIIMNRYNTFVDFLDNTDADWLLCLDTDIVFVPQQIKKLWNLRGHDKQVLTGVYFLLDKPSKILPQVLPCIYVINGTEINGEATCVHPLPVDKVIRIDRAGFGFILMSRNVIKQVLGETRKNPFVARELENFAIVGEDFAFFEALSETGIKAYCDTSIVVNHEKNIGISRFYYDLYWNEVETRLR